jgi:hypothetical protein
MLTSVIDSIAKGDPDIRLVLDLVESDPLAGWSPITITDAEQPTPVNFAGVEVLSSSRIIDLRTAWAGAAQAQGSGLIHMRDRIVMRCGEPQQEPRRIVYRSFLPVADVRYRQPQNRYPLAVRRVAERDDAGAPITRYELHCDLSKAPANELVTIEVAAELRFPQLPPGRMPFVMEFSADLLTVWMLFPENHPYRSYSLLRYPQGNQDAAEPMSARYTIDHPYGQLIGWSVITPREGTVYECRWTSE